MKFEQHLKAELMIFAIRHDFFGYGSSCTKQTNGKYRAIVDCEKYDYTLKQLAEEWDSVDEIEKKEILDSYREKVLLI